MLLTKQLKAKSSFRAEYCYYVKECDARGVAFYSAARLINCIYEPGSKISWHPGCVALFGFQYSWQRKPCAVLLLLMLHRFY